MASCKAMAIGLGDTCNEYLPILCTTQYQVTNFASQFGFFPFAAVHGPTGTVIASSWDNMLAGFLTNSLIAAGVLSVGNRYTTGCSTGGVVSGNGNCNDFTTNSALVNTEAGSSISTSSTWLASGTNACNINGFLVCACIT
jgi:hypothetical protein